MTSEVTAAPARTGAAPAELHELLGLPREVADRLRVVLLDNLQSYTVVLDAAGRVVFVNRRLAETLGVEASAVVGGDWAERIVDEPQRGTVRLVIAEILHSGEPRRHENPIVSGLGRTRIVEWDNAVLRDAAGSAIGLLSFGQDVTERVEAHEALRETASRHQNILDHAVDPIITIGERGIVQSFNAAAERVFGWKPHEVVGQDVSMLMPSPDRERHDGYLAHYLKSGEARIIGIGREVTALRRDGTTFPMYLGVSEVHDVRAGRVFTGLCQDLTERKRVEAQIAAAHAELHAANQRLFEEQAKQLHAERLSSIGLLASGMAHEINNPLMGVIGCIKAIREGQLTPARREDYFEAVREALERIQTTVRSLLDYARQRPPSPSDLAPRELVESCLRLLAPAIRKKDLAVDVEMDVPGLVVHADSSQLIQALVNLLMNAIYAVPVRGTIVVSGHVEERRVGLAIRDDGPGIDPAVVSKVCDPFFTTKPIGEGTGLGLAVTLGIAQAHGGDLQIQSEPGRGTTVTLWLPRASTAPDEAGAATSTQS